MFTRALARIYLADRRGICTPKICRKAPERRMNAARERSIIRMLHLLLSTPILGYLYGPVARIPPAALFTRFVAMPLVIASGLWLWLKPRLLSHLRAHRQTWASIRLSKKEDSLPRSI